MTLPKSRSTDFETGLTRQLTNAPGRTHTGPDTPVRPARQQRESDPPNAFRDTGEGPLQLPRWVVMQNPCHMLAADERFSKSLPEHLAGKGDTTTKKCYVFCTILQHLGGMFRILDTATRGRPSAHDVTS